MTDIVPPANDVRLLTPSDAEAYVGLRRMSLLDAPLALTASPDDDFASSVETIHRQLGYGPDWAILGAFDPQLAGAVGVMRSRHVKTAHKLILWGFWIDPDHRGRGLGRRLMQAALDHARSVPGAAWLQLSVGERAVQARYLYEQFGFQLWGSEPDAIRYGGESEIEHHMALKLWT